MAIKASYIVALTPRVIGGGSNDLDTNGCVLSKSALIPADAPALSFGSATAVADFFGGLSDEAIFATQYFSGLNNQQQAPKALIIGRRIDEDAAAWLRSAPADIDLAELKSVTDGAITITVGAQKIKATGITLGTINSMSDVAAAIAAKLTGVSGEYNSALKAFILTTEAKGADARIGYAEPVDSGTDLGAMLGLTESAGAVKSAGMIALTESENRDAIAAATGNWVTFTTLWEVTDLAEAKAFSAWADIDDDFVYVHWTNEAKLLNPLTAAQSVAGQLKDVYNCTMCVFGASYLIAAFVEAYGASIKWDAEQGMKVIFGKAAGNIPATVVSQSQAEALDAVNVSYMGLFATRNDTFTFANRGHLTSDLYGFIDVLLGSIWFRAKVQRSIMDGFASVNRVPYNPRGFSLIDAWLSDPINAAKRVGVIDTGLRLSDSQKAQLMQECGKDISEQLFSTGYWYNIEAPEANVRANRGTPSMSLYYTYAGSCQKCELPCTVAL